MADAKKCDRCGKYYDDYDGVGFPENSDGPLENTLDLRMGKGKYDRMHLVRADDYGNRRFDLCPDCMAALISFIKQGEKKC